MAQIFISDGAPDAEEYDNNYIQFDASNPQVMSAVERILSTQDYRNNSPIRNRLEEICRSSLIKAQTNSDSFFLRTRKWLKSLVNVMPGRNRLHTVRCFS
jgi:hypothetical protein